MIVTFRYCLMKRLLTEGFLKNVQSILHDSTMDRDLLNCCTKRSIVQVGVNVDCESVTNPEQQVCVP